MGTPGIDPSRLRVLVALCSYGEKHLPFVRRIIATYHAMSFKVDVVVLSEAPKDLGSDVRVVVGLPSADPWSLGFAHKDVFAAAAADYDVFIYSEDDVEITEANIRAFLRATEQLRDDEIAGMFRHEYDAAGQIWLNDFYAFYHWRPDSVARRGEYVIAEYSNAHSACYLVTQSQLKRAIASGGFVRPPAEGVYDLLCAAATDVYTRCGFRKVFCISAAQDFFVHHLPDAYPDRAVVSLPVLSEDASTLCDILDGKHPRSTLFEIEPLFWHCWWQKSYTEVPSPEVLSLIPSGASSILSVGAGFGTTERLLSDQGKRLTLLPLDSVIGASLEHRGLDVIYGSWSECLAKLAGRTFDCVLMTNLLHLQRNPDQVASECARLVAPNGALVLAGPNFSRIPWLVRRFLPGPFRALRSFDESGIHRTGPRSIASTLRRAGLGRSDVRWLDHEFGAGALRGKRFDLGRLTARAWALRASRS